MAITHAVTDNDGVNLDNSEIIAMRVMDDEGVKLVKAFNPSADIPKDYIYNNYAGTSTNVIVEKLIMKYDLPLYKVAEAQGLPASATLKDIGLQIADFITKETNRRFVTDGLSVPVGTTEAWKEVRGMLGADNVALATTSREDRMRVSLDCAIDPMTGKNAGLGELFPEGPLCISGFYEKNKYDYAFGLLKDRGFTEEGAVIVEDSKSGVNKARYRADGEVRPSKVIGTVASSYYPDKEAQVKALLAEGADIVISDMRDLPNAVQWLNADLDPAKKPAFNAPVFKCDVPPARPGT